MLSQILEQFVEDSPVSVMAQTLMSRIFAPETIDALFEKYATRQYQQDLLFSSLVDLMSTVVCGICPSVNAAYRKKSSQLAVSTYCITNFKEWKLKSLKVYTDSNQLVR
jgi:hypothetical protein